MLTDEFYLRFMIEFLGILTLVVGCVFRSQKERFIEIFGIQLDFPTPKERKDA